MRHGDYQQPAGVPGAHLPYALTTEGEAQAKGAAEALRSMAARLGCSIHPVIDSSSLRRAWQTASILAAELGGSGDEPEVRQFPGLAERSVGSAANLTIQAIEEIVAADPRFEPLPEKWKSASEVRLPFPGAESLLQAGERVAAHVRNRMNEVAAEATEDTLVIFVGHGGSFRHAAVHLGVLELEEAPRLSMFHCRPVALEPKDGAWEHVAGEWKVRGKPETPRAAEDDA